MEIFVGSVLPPKQIEKMPAKVRTAHGEFHPRWNLFRWNAEAGQMFQKRSAAGMRHWKSAEIRNIQAEALGGLDT